MLRAADVGDDGRATINDVGRCTELFLISLLAEATIFESAMLLCMIPSSYYIMVR